MTPYIQWATLVAAYPGIWYVWIDDDLSEQIVAAAWACVSANDCGPEAA